MHGIETGLHYLPGGITFAEPIEYPELETHRQVAVVRPVPNNVTTANIVSDMQMIMTHKEMITESTRSSPLAGPIFREPDRQVSLTRERISSKMVHEVIEVSIIKPYTFTRVIVGVLISGELRPEAFHIRMIEFSKVISEPIGRMSVRPDPPRLAGIQRLTSDSFLKVLVCPR